jgi:hypothetical protein
MAASAEKQAAADKVVASYARSGEFAKMQVKAGEKFETSMDGFDLTFEYLGGNKAKLLY